MHTDTDPLNDPTIAHIVAAELRRRSAFFDRCARELEKDEDFRAVAYGYRLAASWEMSRAYDLDPTGATRSHPDPVDVEVRHPVATELRRQARALLDKPATNHATVLGYANAAGDLLLRARELDPEGA